VRYANPENVNKAVTDIRANRDAARQSGAPLIASMLRMFFRAPGVSG
jgi:hypothetical protein